MASKGKEEREEKTALILSAGAPHSPLIAGALCALWDTGKTFDVIYTSGATTGARACAIPCRFWRTWWTSTPSTR